MNIVHVTESVMEPGGGPKYLRSLVKVQRAHGDHVSLIDERRGEEAGLGDREGYYHIDFSKSPRRVIEDISTICKETRAQVLHFHHKRNLLGYFRLLGRLARSHPIILSAHDHDFYCPSGSKFGFRTDWICDEAFGMSCLKHIVFDRCHSLRPWVMMKSFAGPYAARITHRIVSRILVNSNYVRNGFLINGFEPKKIVLLPYFVEDSGDGREDLLQGAGDKTVLFSGRITRHKGLEHAIRALGRLEDGCRLVVNGDGPDLGRVRMLVRRWGLESRVSFRGWVDDLTQRRSYQACSVVVLPSLWPEPFGIVGIEAMSRARPVVAYNVGGIPEWLEDGKTGYLVEPFHVDRLAQKIEILLEDNELARNLGENGKRIAKAKFGAEHHYTALKDIYEEILREAA